MLLSTPALLFGLFVMRNKIILPEINYKYYNWIYTGDQKKVGTGIYLLCKCKCGNKSRVRLFSNKRLGSKSCIRCSKHEGDYKHGFSYSRFYKIWIGIKQRCNNIHHNTYKFYGAKGIKCERKSFDDFKNDMYEDYLNHVKKYGEKETTIDRIDFNGNYSKENCRRATNKEQAINKKHRTIGTTGFTAEELSKKYGYTKSTIRTYSYRYKDNLINELEKRKK